jgi:hypothetical protein
MTAAISSRRDLLETAPARRGPPRSFHCHRKPRARWPRTSGASPRLARCLRVSSPRLASGPAQGPLEGRSRGPSRMLARTRTNLFKVQPLRVQLQFELEARAKARVEPRRPGVYCALAGRAEGPASE